jgi:hypothetical protein
MKRIVLLLLLSACESSSSPLSKPVDTDTPTPSTAPSASVSAAPSASAAPTPKGNAPAPSALSFCKASLTSEPLSAICAIGQDWSKAHFECAKPLPQNFCADLSVWGCQYIAPNKPPKVSFGARFVRPGVALKDGEMITDDGLRARFPRAGITRGVSLQTTVASDAEGASVVADQTKKLLAAGCVITESLKPTSHRFDCGSWQAFAQYVDMNHTAYFDADMPTTPDCTKQ